MKIGKTEPEKKIFKVVCQGVAIYCEFVLQKF